MTPVIIMLVATVALFVLDLLAQTHGVDSRPEFDDPRAPAASATKPGRDAAPSAPVVATTWVVRPSNGRVDVFA